MQPNNTPPFYAHTPPDFSNPSEALKNWEPLFTPFDEPDPNDPTTTCSGKNAKTCTPCENLEPHHGHLNKVAHLAAKLAAAMLLANHPCYASDWQIYLTSRVGAHEVDARTQ